MKRSLPLCFVVLSTLIGPLPAAETIPNVRDRVPLEKFVIQAHRGGGAHLPENTLETFRWAWALGIVPEADIRLSQDGVLVAFHDNHFKRLAPGAPESLKSKKVEQLTYDQLRQLDVGAYRDKKFAGQRIPRLETVFAEMQDQPDRWLYLDIKTVSLDRLAELVDRYGLARQVIFTSSKPDLLVQWKTRVPESMTLLWMGGSEEKLRRRIAALEQNDFQAITSLQIHINQIDLSNNPPYQPSPAFLHAVGKKLRSRGITFQVLPWKETDPRVFHRLMDDGVESFATDEPKKVKEAIKAYYKKKQ